MEFSVKRLLTALKMGISLSTVIRDFAGVHAGHSCGFFSYKRRRRFDTDHF